MIDFLLWPVLAAQMLIFGTAAFALISGDEFAPSRLCLWWRGLALLNLAMAPLAFLAIASEMAQMSWLQVMPMLPEIMRETTAGRVWCWRLGTTLVLAAAMWIPARASIGAILALALSALLILFASFSSHAIDKGVMVVAIYALHQGAAATWLGALASLLISARSRAGDFETTVARVSMVSASALAVIVITGVLTAFQWLGWNLHLLLDSAYGRALLWKLAIAAPALMLAAVNRYWHLPRLDHRRIRVRLVRSVAGECIVLLGVLLWSAILANTPPPH